VPTGPPRPLISIWLGDGEEVRIPAGDDAELYGLLARMSRVCLKTGAQSPAVVVWRLDRGEGDGEPVEDDWVK
jgi:hypothetical protein